MLRRIDRDAVAHDGSFSRQATREPPSAANALSLYANPVLSLYGRYPIEPGRPASLRLFLAELDPLLSGALVKNKARARLRRCAEHFLIASQDAHGKVRCSRSCTPTQCSLAAGKAI